jgi:hypothetical protein
MKERKNYQVEYRLLPKQSGGEIVIVKCSETFHNVDGMLIPKSNPDIILSASGFIAYHVVNVFIDPLTGKVGVNLILAEREKQD